MLLPVGPRARAETRFTSARFADGLFLGCAFLADAGPPDRLPALIRNLQVSVGVGVGLRDRLVWRVAVLATCLTLLCVSARSLQRSH
jgi:hypothetical protein